MTLNPFKTGRTPIRPQVAAYTALCGAAIVTGSLLTWLSAHGARPAMGIDHTSFGHMLVYSFTDVASFWRSAGFAVLILGAAMVIGALAGIRTLAVLAGLLALAAAEMWTGLVVHHFNTPGLPNSHYLNPANLPWTDLRAGAWLAIIGAVLGMVSAFWLRPPPSGQQGSEEASADA
jgi:hypothetical protein